MSISKEQLVDFIVAEFGVPRDEIKVESLLFSTGLLDSFSLVEMVTHIEQTAEISIGATEVSLENLDSVERIHAFVQRKIS